MEKKDIIFAIAFATLTLLFLLCFLLFFFIKYRDRRNAQIKENNEMKKNFEQALLQSQAEVQETTFSALARELHDNVGQLLSSSKMLLGIAQRNLVNAPESLNIAEETLGKAIVELRGLSKSMDKEWLEQFQLIQNLDTEINRINSGKMITIQFIHPDQLPLSPDKQIVIFRIIQEGLQNIIKHAGAKNIMIEIRKDEQYLLVLINDDGKGFTEESSSGLGIKNMKHRTKLLGGDINWKHPGNGSCVTIKIPLQKNDL